MSTQPLIDIHQRGVAAVSAVLMLSVVATVIVSLTSTFSFEIERTRSTIADAQLRQMLIAGARVAKTHLQQAGSDTASPRSVRFPQADADDDRVLSITVLPASGEPVVRVRVDAKVGRRHGTQTVTFERAGDEYHLLDARLGEQ
jgi:type II secretory pathway component PulK